MDLREGFLVLKQVRATGKQAHADAVKEFKRRLRSQLSQQMHNRDKVKWHYIDEEGTRRRCFIEAEADEQDYKFAKEEGLDIARYLERQYWETQAEKICSPYDCTGLWFTASVAIAHIKGNLFKVMEVQHLDV